MIALAFLAALWTADSPLLEAKPRLKVAALYARLGGAALRLEPDTNSVPSSIHGPGWAAGWELERDGGRRPGGTEAVTLVWKSADGERTRRDWIQVRVRREEPVPSAKGRIERGERLDSSRVTWTWTRTDGSRVQPPPPDSLGDYRARTGISPGQQIWKSQLERFPLFKAGETVRIVTGSRGAEASVDGIAVDDGHPGTRIRVKSPWGRTLTGVTENDGSVRVK